MKNNHFVQILFLSALVLLPLIQIPTTVKANSDIQQTQELSDNNSESEAEIDMQQNWFTIIGSVIALAITVAIAFYFFGTRKPSSENRGDDNYSDAVESDDDLDFLEE